MGRVTALSVAENAAKSVHSSGVIALSLPVWVIITDKVGRPPVVGREAEENERCGATRYQY